MEDDGRSWPLPSNFVTIKDLRERWLKRREEQQPPPPPEVEEQGSQRPQLPESRPGRRNLCFREPRVLPESSQRWWSCKEENVEENSSERGDDLSGAGSSSGKKPGWTGESSGDGGSSMREGADGKDPPLMVKAEGNERNGAVGEQGVAVEAGGRPKDIPQGQRRASLNRRDDSPSECVKNGVGKEMMNDLAMVGDGFLSRKGRGSWSGGKRAVVENGEVEALQEGSPGQGASSKNGKGDRFRPKNKGKFVDNGVAVAAGEGEGPVEGATGGSFPLRKGALDESKSEQKNQVAVVEVLSNEVDENEGAPGEGIPFRGGGRRKSKSKKKNVVKKNQVEVLKVLAVEAAEDEGASGEGVPLRKGGWDESKSKGKNVIKRNQVDVVEVLSSETAKEETGAKSKSVIAPLAGDDGMGLPEEAKKKSEQSWKGERRTRNGESKKYVVVGRKESQVESGPGIGDAVSLDPPLVIEGRFSRIFTEDGDRKMRRHGPVLKERDGYGKGYNGRFNEGEGIWVKKGDSSTNQPLRAS